MHATFPSRSCACSRYDDDIFVAAKLVLLNPNERVGTAHELHSLRAGFLRWWLLLTRASLRRLQGLVIAHSFSRLSADTHMVPNTPVLERR